MFVASILGLKQYSRLLCRFSPLTRREIWVKYFTYQSLNWFHRLLASKRNIKKIESQLVMCVLV